MPLEVALTTTKKRTSFNPTFAITPAVASGLMRIEAVKQAIRTLPITPRALANLRETARLFSTHYSTMIEGNRLTQEQVAQVIGEDQHFPGRERDQDEVKGYTQRSTKQNVWQKDVRKFPRRPCKSCTLWSWEVARRV
jgi:Fic family protein